jgi:WS/DGAT/MGAT family acyltransferase
VVDPAAPVTDPVWADADDFSLDAHVRREAVGSREEALEAAARIAMRPLDRARPLWEGVLLEVPEGGRDEPAAPAVYLLRTHHVLADPLGMVQLLSMLQSRTRRHTAGKPVTARVPTAPPAPVGVAARGMLREATSLPALAGAAVRTGLAAARHPRTVVGSGLRYAASVRRLVAGPPAPPSPLLTGRTGESWRFVALTAPLAPLQRVADLAGASLQDVTVAVVLGGLRHYHLEHGSEPTDLPIGVRVSLDRSDDLGNRHAGAMIAGPVSIEDPVDRTAAVRGELLSLHTESALEAFAAFAPVANRLPPPVGAAVLSAGASADALVLTLPGPGRTTYMAGAKVLAMHPFGPLPGVALTATLLSLAETACLGVTVDGDAVDDVDVLEECLAAGLAEVVEAGSRGATG